MLGVESEFINELQLETYNILLEEWFVSKDSKFLDKLVTLKNSNTRVSIINEILFNPTVKCIENNKIVSLKVREFEPD